MRLFLGMLVFMQVLGCVRTKEPTVHVSYKYKTYEGRKVWIKGGHGTGFFVSRRGYIVTAAHVISEGLGSSRSVWVHPNGPKRPRRLAQVVEADFGNDLALLKIFPSSTHKVYKFCSEVQPDEVVIVKAWRHPKKETTIGHTLKPRASINSFLYSWIAAWSYPGFSGSPVVSHSQGCVVGVLTHRGLKGDAGTSYVKHPQDSQIMLRALKKHAPKSVPDITYKPKAKP